MALMGSRRRAYHRAEAKRKRSKWVPSAEAAAREIRRTRKLRYRKHRRHVLLVVLAVSLAIGALASALVLRLVTVRGTGMSPTLESGECVLCVRQDFLDKTIGLLPERIWRIGRDDLVLIDYAPKDDEGNRKKGESALLVKRVIGVGGDVIDVQDGQMTVNGNPVPGAAVNFCTDAACTMAQGGEDGVITFDGAPENYHVQILKVPEGYSFDQAFELYTGETCGEWVLHVANDRLK